MTIGPKGFLKIKLECGLQKRLILQSQSGIPVMKDFTRLLVELHFIL